MPHKIRHNEVLRDMLLLLSIEVPLEMVERLSDADYDSTEAWASMSIYDANDNDVIVPEKPQWLAGR